MTGLLLQVGPCSILGLLFGRWAMLRFLARKPSKEVEVRKANQLLIWKLEEKNGYEWSVPFDKEWEAMFENYRETKELEEQERVLLQRLRESGDEYYQWPYAFYKEFPLAKAPCVCEDCLARLLDGKEAAHKGVKE